MWVIIPVKQFQLAKQRLSPVLNAEERIYLAKMMLHDVLQSLTNAPEVTHTVIVSRDPAASEVASAFGCTFLNETDTDLSLAVAQGARFAQSHGAAEFTMVPGDVPLLETAEVSTLIDAGPKSTGLTIVTDRNRTGTNAMVVKPVDIMPFAFGEDSYQLHTEAARRAGGQVRTLMLPGLSLDIDTPEDLQRLLQHRSDTASAGYLNSIEAGERLEQHPFDGVIRAEFG